MSSQPSLASRRVRKLPPRCRPQVELLEPRATPSADLFQNMVEEIWEQAPAVVPSTPYFLGLMRTDGSFSDLNYKGNSDASAADLQQHGLRLKVLSLAYQWSDPSNSYFNDSNLRSGVLRGWTFVATKGSVVTAPNWWWKAIGVPQGMADGLVLMRSELPTNVQRQILTKYFSTVWNPSKYDGANIAYQAPIAMIDGLLRGDAARMRDVVSKLSKELLAYTGEGIQRDLSFLQHRVGNKLNYYSGSYGLVLARDTARVMRWANGTPYAFGAAAIDQEVRFMVDGLAWLTRGDTFDIPAQGRSITRAGSTTNAPYVLRNAMIDLVPLGIRTNDLLAAIDRYDVGLSNSNALSGNKSFWKGDSMVNQRATLMTTVKLLSNRTARPETAAGENTQGFFLGDGFTMFVQDGDEFGALGGPEIMPVWNWQRLPGTTVEQNGVIPYYDMFKTATHSAGASSIVGSVSDGMYGLAAMDYRRSGVGVTARKSWFFFDTEVVALGADIDNPQGSSPVFTSLNQVLLDGPVTVQDASGRRTLGLGDSADLTGDAWIWHDGLGYVLLDGNHQTTVQAQYQQSANGLTLPVFSTWIDHGVAPLDATYAYAVVPGKTPDTLDAYAGTLPIKILANTSAVQAVQHTGLEQTQIAFYGAGSVQIADDLWIAVNRPANLIVTTRGNGLTISAADPTQSVTSLSIDVSRRLAGPGVTWLPASQVTRIALSLPAGPYLGSSVTQSFTGLTDNTVVVSAAADAFVRNGSHAVKNFGGGTTLDIQYDLSGNRREALLRFDVAAIAAEIVRAEVRLTAVAGAKSMPIAAAGVANDAWDESLVTWNLKPISSGQLGQASIKQGQTVAFDVTALVQAAAFGDGQVSLRVFAPTKTSSSISLGAREQSNPQLQPVLEILVRSQVADPPGEGEAYSHPGLALQDLVAASLTGPLRLAEFLSSRPTAHMAQALVLAPANNVPVNIASAAPGRFTPLPASSGRIARGHGQPLDASVFGVNAIDAALEVWGGPLD